MAIFLETHRLVIKIPKATDINNWIALHGKSEAMSKAPDIVQEWLKSDMTHFEKHGFGMGSVYEKDSKEFVGRAGLFYVDHNDAQPHIEIGYVLRKAFWNKGYATELAKALIEWGFDHLHVDKLVAITNAKNKSSQRVLEKVGMQYKNIVQFHGKNFLFYEIQRSLLIV